MSIDGRPAPRPKQSPAWPPAALALLVPCGFCWAEPGTSCTGAGQHYARYLRAYRRLCRRRHKRRYAEARIIPSSRGWCRWPVVAGLVLSA